MRCVREEHVFSNFNDRLGACSRSRSRWYVVNAGLRCVNGYRGLSKCAVSKSQRGITTDIDVNEGAVRCYPLPRSHRANSGSAGNVGDWLTVVLVRICVMACPGSPDTSGIYCQRMH